MCVCVHVFYSIHSYFDALLYTFERLRICYLLFMLMILHLGDC